MDYKDEIRSTRVGCLGGSDGRMLQQISECGYVPDSAKKRLAICRGLIENDDSYRSRAMEWGDTIEQAIFSAISSGDEQYESNPLWKSDRYSKPMCALICHPDFVKYDEDSRTIFAYECKCTKFTIEETLRAYRAQLFIEYSLGHEIAKKRGRNWKVRLFLVHYSTADMGDTLDFDAERMTLREVKFRGKPLDIGKAMSIVDEYLANLEYYSDGDVVEAYNLPTEVYDEFASVSNILREIKQREKQVEEFKERLYNFLTEKGITKVRCDTFSFSVVAPTTQTTFDTKKFMEDYEREHPRAAKKLRERYKRTSNKKGYVKITVRDDDD